VSACRSCGAAVIWTRTAAGGKPMPVDAEPVEGGNVLLSRGRAGIGTPTATVLAPGTPMPVGVIRYASHFATCPHANDHRRTR
jgi:hypothetical protein